MFVQFLLSASFAFIATVTLRVTDREAAEALFLPLKDSFNEVHEKAELRLFTFDTERRAVARGQRLLFIPTLCLIVSTGVALVLSTSLETTLSYRSSGRFSRIFLLFTLASGVISTRLNAWVL